MSRNAPIGGYLLTSATASGQVGEAADNRNAANYAFMWSVTDAGSALVVLQASPDATAWFNALIVTAVAGSVTSQISAFYPFVRAACSTRWGNATATVHFTPGIW